MVEYGNPGELDIVVGRSPYVPHFGASTFQRYRRDAEVSIRWDPAARFEAVEKRRGR